MWTKLNHNFHLGIYWNAYFNIFDEDFPFEEDDILEWFNVFNKYIRRKITEINISVYIPIKFFNYIPEPKINETLRILQCIKEMGL